MQTIRMILGRGVLLVVLAALGLVVACGSSATSTPQVEAVPATKALQAAATAVPQATTAPPQAVSAGTITIGYKEIGSWTNCYPRYSKPPSSSLCSRSMGEGLFWHTTDRVLEGMLLEDWSVSGGGTVWTLNVRKGVSFHGGWGEFKASDLVYNMKQYGHPENASIAQADIARIWLSDDATMTTPDDYTVILDTGILHVDLQKRIIYPGVWMTPEKQFVELGAQQTSLNTAGTGPWEFTEWRLGEFWKFEAVEDHWRQTPHFAEMVFLELPEESTRIANFKAGLIDTFAAEPETVASLETLPGVTLLRKSPAWELFLTLHGQFYDKVNTPTGEPWPGYQPELPWVSSNANTSSPEWEQARKVREALNIAIDRELIVSTLLEGHGRPTVVQKVATAIGYHQQFLGDKTYKYDPERAKQLLIDAGYPDGFSITLQPTLRGGPAERPTTEAVLGYWEAIGIDVKLDARPYSAMRPNWVNRVYDGATLHGDGLSYTEPMFHWNITANPKGRFSVGFEHPFITERLIQLFKTGDETERLAIQKEMANWLFDNAQMSSIWVADIAWPLGPNLEGAWEDHAAGRDSRNLSGVEYARPSK